MNPIEAQNAVFMKRRNRSSQRPPRSARGEGRTVVLPGRTAMRPPVHKFLHFPALLFVFHMFFSLSFCFGFKRELNLAYLGGRIHSKNSNSQNAIEEVEGRRRGIRRHWKRNRKIDVLSEHKLSHLFFFLLISSILVRIS